MVDFLLMLGLGFLGSFGHCLGMCGPLAVTLAVSRSPDEANQVDSQLRFHLLLNLGRILSYALVGAAIGAIGSLVVASGQLAGIGSDLRRWIAIASGLLLIWFGLVNLNPQLLPPIPLLNPMAQGNWHDRLSRLMSRLSGQRHFAVPLGLGLVWGLIPCGFLYAAQIKAAETTEIWRGSLTMLAFGLGTLPSMLGVGVASSWLSRDRRSQLYRLGGWITLGTGLLILLRTGDTMGDYAGYGGLLLLSLALVARPISRLWAAPLQYRRAIGVGAFVLSCIHVLQTVAHHWNWQWQAVAFMVPQHQCGVYCGMGAFGLMTPLALTSCDRAQQWLGQSWRRLHLLAVPALGLVVTHCLLVGSRFFGRSQTTWVNAVMVTGIAIATLGVMLLRSPRCWNWLRQGDRYAPPRP